MLEKSHERRFVGWLKKNKVKWKKKAPGELLDRYIFLPKGHLYVIELKREGGKLSRRQIKEIKELKELGYDVEVHYSAESAIEAVRSRLEAGPLSEKSRKVRPGKFLRRASSRPKPR